METWTGKVDWMSHKSDLIVGAEIYPGGLIKAFFLPNVQSKFVLKFQRVSKNNMRQMFKY